MYFDPEGRKDRGFGSVIRRERLRRNLSEEELADLLEVPPRYIFNAERGRTANRKIKNRLCQFFMVEG